MQKKSKISIFIIGLVIVLTSIGLSYAYWKTTIMGDKGNNVTSGCFNIEMINQKDEITLGSTFPITDAEGLKLKPFSFTLKNTCTIFAHYYVNMEMLEGTTLNNKFVAVRVNNEAINTLDTYKVANTTVNTSTESRTIAEGYLGADEEVDYTVSFWMDEDATIDDDVMNKVFKSKIVINSEPGKYDPVSAGYDTLHDAILANEYQTTPEIAKTKIASKQEVDLSNTAPAIKWVEKTGENVSLNSLKIASSSIKIDNQTNNLTQNDTKLKFYNSYEFNEATGKYILLNPVVVDPTELSYENTNNYYFHSESTYYNKDLNKLMTSNTIEDLKIYQILGASKTQGKTKWNNTNYDSTNYKLNATELLGTELETDKSDKGLYQETDNYGTTYYYRGNVKNNNVYFAGFYWQIVRINGDGSIRLMYNGTEKNATGSKQNIGNSSFNIKNDDPAYVGYMYGNPDASTFDEVHANINSSTIKENVDKWYVENIINNGYKNYISSNAGFCGDKSLNGGDGVSNNVFSYFGAHQRYKDNLATFTCPNIERDLYTTVDSNTGNKALAYPIGLITYDELVFAGMDYNHINKLSYVYSSQFYWTMTPAFFDKNFGYAKTWNQYADGYLRYLNYVTRDYGIRPVINLKADVKITGGIGTANDPFVVDTNN